MDCPLTWDLVCSCIHLNTELTPFKPIYEISLPTPPSPVAKEAPKPTPKIQVISGKIPPAPPLPPPPPPPKPINIKYPAKSSPSPPKPLPSSTPSPPSPLPSPSAFPHQPTPPTPVSKPPPSSPKSMSPFPAKPPPSSMKSSTLQPKPVPSPPKSPSSASTAATKMPPSPAPKSPLPQGYSQQFIGEWNDNLPSFPDKISGKFIEIPLLPVSEFTSVIESCSLGRVSPTEHEEKYDTIKSHLQSLAPNIDTIDIVCVIPLFPC